jgi:mannan endo-1,4-beta-mannosidase
MGKRSIFSLMMAALVAIGAFVYLSPPPPAETILTAPAARSTTVDSAAASAIRRAAARAEVNTTTAKIREKSKAAKRKARTAAARARARDNLDGVAVPKPRAKEKTVVRTVKTITDGGSTGGAGTAAPPPDPTLPPVPKDPVCSDYLFQQDAQAVYVANLADPFGLDGAPGPANDDGIACSLLPVDPARPASVAVGAKPPPPPPPPEPMPETPTMQALLAPELNYFGVSTPQAPYDFKDYSIFAAAAGKLPNMNEFFLGWDREYPANQVIALWRRGALPILSWEPRPTVNPSGPYSDNTVAEGYELSSIIDGSHDEYIDRFATAVRDLDLPIAIRFAHEMNGNWFPWSEERNGNAPGEYVQAWRHLHDRFTALGADNVIWIWSPNVVTARPSVRLAPLYPGDDYVDWLGIVGYYRRVYYDAEGNAKAPTFDNTYSETLAELRSVAAKPIVLTEVGATEIGGNKPAWITSLFQGMADNPDIIGFVWFDHSVNGTDWRIESSRAASEAFAAGVANPRYGTGTVYVPR